MKLMGVGFLAMFVLTACAHYKTTLTDDHGRTVTCEASGKNGIVTGYYLRKGYQACLNAAKAKGYTDRGIGGSAKNSNQE
jgi:hypothetical protein